MAKIKILSPQLQNMIAAGEVIERPASVVKELIDNSIDAGAIKIDIEILKAGKKLIRVSDNGCGMAPDDAILAFQRFATSKLQSEQDLFNLKTHGFRGEALASIASVARVTLCTAEQGKDGCKIDIVPNMTPQVSLCSIQGTDVQVKELFFNLPARLKFLKSDTTENAHIINIITAISLAYPQISFSLKIDNKLTMQLPSVKSMRERILTIYGVEFTSELIELYKADKDMVIAGFVSKKEALKRTKKIQFLYVNNHYVTDYLSAYAVSQGYGDAVQKEMYPAMFIKLTLPSHMVDFNVHPAKKEVRFADKAFVYNFITSSIRGLFQTSMVKHTISTTTSSNYNDFFQTNKEQPTYISDSIVGFINSYDVRCLHITDSITAVADSEGLLLIDYHAAHERINYEKLLKSHGLNEQMLLFPIQVRLDDARYRAILSKQGEIRKLALSIEDFGSKTVIVRSMPDFITHEDITKLLPVLADNIIESEKIGEDIMLTKKRLATTIACHHSMRAGSKKPTEQEIASLINELKEMQEPDVCPHGRPTMIRLTSKELLKMFKKG